MQFKTFTSKDANELDNQINSWLVEGFKNKVQVLDLKQNTAICPDGSPFFTACVIWQIVPDLKVPNPCCRKEASPCEQPKPNLAEDCQPVVQKEGEEPQEGVLPLPVQDQAVS